MKFELKTDNEYSSKSFFPFCITLTIITFIVIFSSISIKLGSISKHFEIDYLCKVLISDKSSSNFNKLSRLLKKTSKQKIWNLCRDIVR